MQKYGELSLCFHIFPVIASYHGKASWNKDPPFTWVRTSKTGDEIRMASVCGMEGHIQGLRFHCSLGERLNSENRIFFMCFWLLLKDILHTFSNRKEIITQFKVSTLLKMSTSQWLSNVIVKSFNAILALRFCFIVYLRGERECFKPKKKKTTCFYYRIPFASINRNVGIEIKFSTNTCLMNMYYAPTLC